MVWSGVRQLHTFGFTVLLICCDGAASNYMGVSSVATNSVSRHSVAIDSCSTSLLLAAVLSRASKGLAVEPYKEPTTAVDMHVDGEAFSSGGTCVQGLQLVCCVASAHSPRACLAISNTMLTTYFSILFSTPPTACFYSIGYFSILARTSASWCMGLSTTCLVSEIPRFRVNLARCDTICASTII
eukprot:scpid84133/ scgid19658/ 